MNIGDAVRSLKRGLRVRRPVWVNAQFLHYVHTSSWSTQSSVPVQPFIAVHLASGAIAVWTCSQADLIAEDWEVL